MRKEEEKQTENLLENYLRQLNRQQEETERAIAAQEARQRMLAEASNTSYVHELLREIRPNYPAERIERMKRTERRMALNEALTLIGKSIAAWEGIQPQPADPTPVLRSMYKRWQLEDDFAQENRRYRQLLLSDAYRREAAQQQRQAAAQEISARQLERLYEQRRDLEKASREATMTDLKARNEREAKEAQYRFAEQAQQTRFRQQVARDAARQEEGGGLKFRIPGTEQTITIPPEIRTYLQAAQWEKPLVREDLRNHRTVRTQQQILNQGVISDYLKWMKQNQQKTRIPSATSERFR